jgi:hypothetical protein
MRSIVLALAFAAPLSAVAATPYTYTHTNPTRVHAQKPQTVMITFVNRTSQDREVVVGNQAFKIQYFKKMNLELPVGSDVRLYSETNSKINGQVLMQVSPADQNTDVVLR